MTVEARNVKQMISDAKAKGEKFDVQFRKELGITEDRHGSRKLNKADAKFNVDEFSITDLAEEFLGHETVSGLRNPKTAQQTLSRLTEALSPVLPSAFEQINAFNATVGSLLETRILEGYQSVDFIGDSMCTTVPTNVNGHKAIAIPRTPAPANETLPGEEYENVGLTQRWVQAPANKKYGQKLSLARETIIYDLTGQLFATAYGVGYALGQLRDVMIGCCVMGINLANGASNMFPEGFVGQNYRYDALPSDTPGNTYQTVAGVGANLKYNYINQLPTNFLVDWTNLQNAQAQLNLAREFETNFAINGSIQQILVSPQVLWNCRNIVHATTVFGQAMTPQSTNVPQNYTNTANPVPSLDIYSSTIWNKLLVDSGVSQANADKAYWTGEFKKSFQFAEVWPMSTAQASPSSSELIGRDIVQEWVTSWYGVAYVVEPRHMVQSGL